MNLRVLAILEILILLALTIWRIMAQQVNRFRSVWATLVLGLIISVASDVDPGFGAAFGGAIVTFMLIKTLAPGLAALGISSSSSAPAPPAGHAAVPSPANPAPTGPFNGQPAPPTLVA